MIFAPIAQLDSTDPAMLRNPDTNETMADYGLYEGCDRIGTMNHISFVLDLRGVVIVAPVVFGGFA